MAQQGSSVRAMARTLGRSAGTVSRELARNCCARVGYASEPAGAMSRARRIQARPPAKLDGQAVLWGVVLTLLEWKWSPQQIGRYAQARVARRSQQAGLARDHLHGHLRAAARRAAPPTHCLPAPRPQHAPAAQAWPMRHSLTYDQGKEMSRHAELAARTGVKVFFCDPHSPWQRGTCEHTNGPLRQHLPKGTDLSTHSQDERDAIADSLNGRPRATHTWCSPLQVFALMLSLPINRQLRFIDQRVALQP
jgi:IS30 family transposase